jgi:transcription-repair coupling factor (superfamily II helicase)
LATIYGAPEGYDALLLIRRANEHKGTLLHVARHEGRMRRLAEYLNYFAPDMEVLTFPAWDCLPYDRVSPNPAVVSERIATLSRLLESATGPRVVITTVNAAVQKIPPQTVFLDASLTVKAGGTVKPEKLIGIPRLRPRRHGDGTRRVCRARRHHRHFPKRRIGPPAPRFLR